MRRFSDWLKRCPMREQLLGYLLGALEAAERQEVESALLHSPALRAELETLRLALSQLEGAEEIYEPPASLTERTCDVVFQHDWLPEGGPAKAAAGETADLDPADPAVQEAAEFSRLWDDRLDEAISQSAENTPEIGNTGDWVAPATSQQDDAFFAAGADESGARRRSFGSGRKGRLSSVPAGAAANVRSWSVADFVVASGVFLAAALLFFPAIANSRSQSRALFCQNNLRRLNEGLGLFSDFHDGQLPAIPLEGNLAVAGVYGPTLVQNQYIDDPRTLLCPGSPWAQSESGWRAPTIEEVMQAEGELLTRLQQMMGGGYGYTLGYVDNGEYRPTRNLGRPFFVVIGDAPALDLPGGRSMNHENGQNVLCEDGSIRFIASSADAPLVDDPFVNRRGQVAAGVDINDAVLGGSATPPLDIRLISGR